MSEEEEEPEKEEADADMPFEQRDSDGNFLLTKKPIGSNEEDHTLARKFAQQTLDEYLTIKSEDRQTECWSPDCVAPPIAWVREIQFDMLGDKAGINQNIVSSRDYVGPVPGFCVKHIATGPPQLAERVYWDQTEISLGLRPRKWWVIFTDGTKQGGLCEVLNPKNLKPITQDLHMKNSTN
jgi:hypothetical protein